ncbi:Alpha/beta hydrolase family protein [compost metagenome]
MLHGAFAAGVNCVGTAEEIEAHRALASLLRLGWGLNNPAFCTTFTSRFVPESTPEHQRWFDEMQRVSTSPENAARLLERGADIDVRPLLSRVDVPTLVLHCDDDRAVPTERGRALAAGIRGARYVSLPSANHLILEDEPAWPLFLEEVGLFLSW